MIGLFNAVLVVGLVHLDLLHQFEFAILDTKFCKLSTLERGGSVKTVLVIANTKYAISNVT
jgi:hypothetical protein